MRTHWCLIGLSLAVAAGGSTARAATFRTITSASQAAIVVDNTYKTTGEQKAAEMLRDEAAARTGMTFSIVDHTAFTASAGVTGFLVGHAGGHAVIDALRPTLFLPAEGFHLETLVEKGPYVLCAGADTRGALYAVGRCLRACTTSAGGLTVPVLGEEDSPDFPIRGHQLGYRDRNNTIDSWTVPQFEQHFRDLIVFGANAVELIPPRSASDPGQGPLMALNPWDMTVALCSLCDDYDLNVWMWIPAEVDLSDPTQRAALLADRASLFAACSRIDAIFVPGGDPGSNSPSLLMSFVQDLATAVHTYHPSCEVWVSHQGWEITDRDWFYTNLQTLTPSWLTGVVYGPWTRDTLAHTRAQVPSQYKIRRYPDITHCLRSQYPAREWDHSFALTLGREPINPRPEDEAAVIQAGAPYSDGAISYSDGVNDDLNKAIWSALLWDGSADVADVVAEYAHYFIGDEFGGALATNLMALEANWRGDVVDNTDLDATLAGWQAMEASASSATLDNWRFQEGLFRAYYDAYVKARRTEAAQLEQDAYDDLAQAPSVGADTAIDNALATLALQDASGVGSALRTRVEELGADLNASIGIQMSVPLYGASGSERGAVLDFLDEYLNNRLWLESGLPAIKALGSETDKLACILAAINWERAGPDGHFDDLGNGAQGREPHLVHARTYAQDPGYVESAQDEFDWNKYPNGRLSWRRQGQTLYDTPLQVHYDDLDTSADYTLRVTYAGRFNTTMTLDADGTPIHGATGATNPPTWYRYAIPQALTADGELTLTWLRSSSSAGRGPQVAEVWLMRTQPHILINDGDAYAASTTLDLDLWAINPREMQFQYPGSGGWTAWEPFSYSKQITVTASDGPVQVDFRVRYLDMSVSGTYSDTITLDLGGCTRLLSSGYVQPSSGAAGDTFTWRVKYWNACNHPADEAWVAIRSLATGAISWRKMWAYDPSDTNCVDGKWYTYSAPLAGGGYPYRFAARSWATWVYWPQPTGTYAAGPDVNPVVLSSGYVAPTSGTRSTEFAWRVKYWNTLNQPPDTVWCAIWFPTLGTSYWYPMWALDPADTNTRDGKWYTFSRRWLPPGAYAYRFAAKQGSYWAYWPKPPGTYQSGPTVGP